MHRFNANAPHAKASRRTNGATYAPDAASSPLQAVAMKDAAIAVKLMIL